MTHDEARIKFANDLRAARTSRGYTVSGAARLFGFNRNTYRNYETGVTPPTLYDGLALCFHFGLNPWDYRPLKKRKRARSAPLEVFQNVVRDPADTVT